MHRLLPFICGMYFFSACGPGIHTPVIAGYEMVSDHRFYTPCGQPVLNGRLPAGAGDFYVYVLKDSLQVADCIDPEGAAMTNAFPMRFGNDFLLAVVAKGAGKEWYFALEDMTVEDSLLHVKIVPHHMTDTAWEKPRYPAADDYIWLMNGREVKMMKLYINRYEYAFVRGPKWSGAPVRWRLPREKKDKL